MAESSPLVQPIPQRAFDLTPASASSSTPPTPPASSEPNDSSQTDLIKAGLIKAGAPPTPSRTRSILNLTSSTLFGIYTPAEGSSTPWGTGTQTPSFRTSNDDKKPPIIGAFQRPTPPKPAPHQHHITARDSFMPLALRGVLLFLLGVAYGVIVIHLHDDRRVAPVKVEGIERYSWWYLAIWGVAGVLLGNLLPWIDTLWGETIGDDERSKVAETEARPRRASTVSSEEGPASPGSNARSADLMPAIRSMGVFVGIAFAIRKLPWESTLQVSLTLALVNPVLWYVVDRSKAGFLLSALAGIAGTAICLSINPDMVPSPPAVPPFIGNATNVSYESAETDKLISTESIGVGTWIASVLFCSSLFFGNIGRRLALGRHGLKKSDP